MSTTTTTPAPSLEPIGPERTVQHALRMRHYAVKAAGFLGLAADPDTSAEEAAELLDQDSAIDVLKELSWTTHRNSEAARSIGDWLTTRHPHADQPVVRDIVRRLHGIEGDLHSATMELVAVNKDLRSHIDGNDQADDTAEDETAPETARLTADYVLIGVLDGLVYVLMVRRTWPPFADSWALPGGHVDQDEDVQAAARRELEEETGISVAADPDLVGVYAEPGRDPRGRYVTWAYTARVNGLPTPEAGDDAAEAAWFLVDELLADPEQIAFDHARIIRDALRTANVPETVQ